MEKGTIITALKENAAFMLICIAATAGILAVAWLFERSFAKRNGSTARTLTTRKVAMIGMFSAIAGILYCVDFALPIAPSFYKIDLSEMPALIAGFAFGPVAGVLVEFLKVVIKLLLKSTDSAFVGDFANFLIGCMLVLPSSVIYSFRKTRKRAILSLAVGTAVMAVFGTWFNAVYLLPTFAVLYGLPLDQIIAMGTAINPAVRDLGTFVLFTVAPINIIKGTLVSVLTMLVYKKISRVIK
ncbi:MAG: ECF transporter S component [Lachnospiraceae bacterium]|jgi:riboflavin transporter FmnP|nr:ECF transporter S component [Lachnospiraceae bacterium]